MLYCSSGFETVAKPLLGQYHLNRDQLFLLNCHLFVCEGQYLKHQFDFFMELKLALQVPSFLELCRLMV